MTRPFRAAALTAFVSVTAAGCGGLQSALDPAGEQAARVADLFWWMTAGAVVVWMATIAVAVYYGRPHDEAPSPLRDRWLILGGGIVIPTIVLTALLIYGLAMLPSMVARAPEGSLVVAVEGEQWWWRVRYERPGQPPVELANEVRLPVGEPVQFRLTSDNVIHAFWIPALGGKMDMIPGRTTYLALTPTRTGVFAGACAEYCGTAHGWMRFGVEVMEREAFEAWLAVQARPAVEPVRADAARGRDVLIENGCGACHTVRGTHADGVIGPDLTHVGGRMGLAAASLGNGAEALARWIARAEEIKPGVHMPAFDMLPPDDLRALALYLEGLQ